jgi:hypothetical protein
MHLRDAFARATTREAARDLIVSYTLLACLFLVYLSQGNSGIRPKPVPAGWR